MTPPEIPPVTNQDNKGTITYGVGLTARATAYGDDNVLSMGPVFQVEAEKNGYSATAEVGGGYRGAFAGLEVGKKWDFNKNFGLELSGDVNYTINPYDKREVRTDRVINVSVNSEEIKPIFQSDRKTWNPAVLSTGATVMPKFTSNNKKLELGIGVTAQYAKNNGREVSLPETIIEVEHNGQNYKFKQEACKFSTKKEGLVVSPVVNLEYKPNENLSFKAEASKLGGGVTACWNF